MATKNNNKKGKSVALIVEDKLYQMMRAFECVLMDETTRA